VHTIHFDYLKRVLTHQPRAMGSWRCKRGTRGVRIGVSSDPYTGKGQYAQNSRTHRILNDLAKIKLRVSQGSSDPKCPLFGGHVRDNSFANHCLRLRTPRSMVRDLSPIIV